MNFLSLLPIIQLIANVGLTLAGQYGAIPIGTSTLVAQLEAAFGPLFAAIASKSSTTEDVQAAIGASIGVLSVLKAQHNIDPTLLAKIDEQLVALQAALAAEVAASKGFDPSSITPVTPIA